MNEIKIFENQEFGKIRTLEMNGEPWFVGKDVATILGYAKPLNALAAHIDEDDSLKQGLIDNMGRTQETILINESGLYSLILSSKLESAKQFKRWITHEVIPSIRKTGGYVSNDDLFISTYLPYADDATKALFQSTLATVRSLNAKIEADKPKVLFADSVAAAKNSILIGDLAKLIRQNGVDIGQKRLFQWMRDNGFLIKCGESRNMPTQKGMELELFDVKETTINNPDGSVRITKTPKVTGKGQAYFINRFLAKQNPPI